MVKKKKINLDRNVRYENEFLKHHRGIRFLNSPLTTALYVKKARNYTVLSLWQLSVFSIPAGGLIGLNVFEL